MSDFPRLISPGPSREGGRTRASSLRIPQDLPMVSVMKKLLLVTWGAGVLLLGSAAAASSADIVGTIVNPSGAPIPGVTVSAQTQAGAAVGSGVTDEAGRYVVHGLVPGTYVLVSKGQSAVTYVGDQGVTVDWGIAADSRVIAAARQGTAPPLSGKSPMNDLTAGQFGAGHSDRNHNRD